MFPAEKTIPQIAAALEANRSVVLQAPPGSGKTTCVPPALLDAPFMRGKSILMLEPRRLAARMAAARIAASMGEKPGGTVGYHIRLDRCVSARTRLEILTEGLLSRRLAEDPGLEGAGLVVFDEFHERSLACDLGFAMTLDVRRALRPDLRMLVMSATLDCEAVAERLGDAVTVTAEAGMFPVETRFLPFRTQARTPELTAAAAWRAAAELPQGDILAFLPGEREIRACRDILEERFAGAGSFAAGADGPAPKGRWTVHPLYGALPREEQDAAVAPAPPGVRKIVLATSIAETSLTLPGVRGVVDSGEMRTQRFSAATGMSALATRRVTRDRADQRRGRAGRTAPGICWRLWTEAEDHALEPSAAPEIMDADLAPVVLQCAAWGVRTPDGLPWMTPPPAGPWARAAALLRDLGAIGPDGAITGRGREMAEFPVHPRLSHAILSAARRGAAARACFVSAVIEERANGAPRRETDARRLADLAASPRGGAFAHRVAALAARWARRFPRKDSAAMDEGSIIALAFPDRIAKMRAPGLFTLSCGINARIDQSDPLASSPFLACAELDGEGGEARILLAAPADADALEELFADSLSDCTVTRWDRRTDSVAAVRRRMLGHVVLRERPDPSPDPGAVAAALMEGVRAKGAANLPCWTPEALRLRSRMQFLHRTMPQAGWPDVSDAAIDAAPEKFLAGFADGFSRWAHFRDLDMARVLQAAAAAAGADLRGIDRLAPARIEMPSGSAIAVDYDGDEPSVAVRLQETFGMRETPRVAGGAVPVLMKLLSPSMRPVQITKDMANFWREGYALVRKEMRGRYPKHYWPEDPLEATPTRRVRPR